MAMNKNTVLAWATWIMIFVGLGLIALGAFRYDETAGWGFASVGVGFLANARVFNALKGRVYTPSLTTFQPFKLYKLLSNELQ